MQTHPNSSQAAYWQLVQGVAWSGLSVAILSGWFVVTRLGFRHDLRVWDIIALRFGEGAALLTPALLIGPSRLQFDAWPRGLVLAALWGAPFIILVAIGLRLTSATLASSVAPALMPVFAGMIGWGFLSEIPQRQLLGYGLIAAGLFALVYAYVQAEGGLDTVGVTALVIAAMMWALYTLRLRRTALTSLQAASLICFWSALLYLPFYFGLGLSNLTHTSGGELLFQSIYQGAMMGVISLFAFNRAVALLGPRAAAIIALVPVVTTLLAIPVLGEWPSWSSSAVICLVALGVVFAASRPTKVTQREKFDDPLLLSPDPQSGKGRADVGGSRAGLSIGTHRHQQGGTAHA
jgi:drug/metabolite transporter (DMT)-like permease